MGECSKEAEQTNSLNTELTETVSALRKEVEEAKSVQQLEQEQSHVSELQTQLEEAGKRETELKGLICELESSASESKKDPDIDMEETSTQKLKEDNQALILQLETVTTELTHMRQSNSSLNKLKQNLDEGITVLQLQVDTQAKQIEDLEREKSDLHIDMSKLKDQSAGLDSTVSSQIEELASNSIEMDNLNALVVSLREDNSIIRDHNSSVQSELGQIVSQLNEATDNNKTLTERLENTNRDVLISKQSNTTHLERISTLEAELQEKQRVEVESLRESSASNKEVEKQLTSAREESLQYKSKVCFILCIVGTLLYFIILYSRRRSYS